MVNKSTSSTFAIEINGVQPTVSREIKFENGDSISFSVTLDRDDDMRLADLHKRSAEHTIKLLQSWITGK